MTDQKEKIHRTTIRIPEHIHKPARIKVAEQNTSFQDAVTALLGEWAGGKRHIVITPHVHQASSHDDDLDRLRYILDHGTPEDKEWIRGNLKNFVEAIRSRQNEPSRKRASK